MTSLLRGAKIAPSIERKNDIKMFKILLDLLEKERAKFRVIAHPAEGRSEDVARLRGTLPGQGAKAMLCKSRDVGNAYVLAILSGDRKLDFKKVAQAAGFKKATLASPDEAMQVTGCVIGAIPPFSFSPDIQLIADPDLLASHPEIAFNAGCLDHSIVLNTADYLRIAQPALHPLCA